MAAIHAHGCRANLITYTPLGSPVVEPPRLVAQAMRSADVLFTLPTVPLTETEAMRIALAEGARALLFGGAAGAGRDDDMLYRLAPTSVEELTRVGGLSTAMTRAFKTGKRVRLTSRRGTDLTLTVGDLDIINMDGRCTEPGMMQFYVPGLVNAGVTPGSVSGRVVFDTSLAPLTGSLPEAVTMTIEDGFVTSVEGGPAAAAWRAMAEGFGDPNVFHVCEFGLGANPRARLSGKIVEEEAATGVAHVGFGTDIAFRGQLRAAWHVDGCLADATVEAGGVTICQDGKLLLDPLS